MMSEVLNVNGQKILKHLVKNVLPNAKIVKPLGEVRNTTTYKKVHEDLGLPYRGRTYGISLENHGLRNMSEWAFDNGLPAIGGLITNEDRTENFLGEGYLKLLERYRSTWVDEIEKAQNTDWSPYL
ncbi:MULTISPECIES: hypothetical protein [Acetobacter]